MQPESIFKRKVDAAFERLFPRGERYSTPIEGALGQKKGLPDRFYSARGGHAWVESKVHPYSLSPLQEMVLPRLARAGSRVIVLTLHQPDRIVAVAYDHLGRPCDPVEWPMAQVTDEAFWSWLLKTTSCCTGAPA